MKIAVASTTSSSNIKLQAVEKFYSKIYKDVTVFPVFVASGVREQPFSMIETEIGVYNRVANCEKKLKNDEYDMIIGIENGVSLNYDDKNGKMKSAFDYALCIVKKNGDDYGLGNDSVKFVRVGNDIVTEAMDRNITCGKVYNEKYGYESDDWQKYVSTDEIWFGCYGREGQIHYALSHLSKKIMFN